MKQITLVIFFLFSGFEVSAQTFISDSLMGILVDSGFANENFIPKGKTRNNVRIGIWDDFTFEFIYTYQQNEDETVDSELAHLLIQSTGKYASNQKEGLWKFNALEEGTLKKYHIADLTYKNGKRDGPVTYYYSSGSKAANGSYKDDILHGNYTVYFKTGEVARSFNLVRDRLQGVMTYFYKTGEKKVELNYINGVKSGEYTEYYKNGAIKTKMHYVNDTLQGEVIQYYSGGQIQAEGVCENGKYKSWKYYYESGQLWVHREYKDGKIYNIKELYDSSGVPLDSGTLKNGTGTVKYYTENAQVYLIRTFEQGRVIHEEQFD